MWVELLLAEHNTWKWRNRYTDGHRHMYISQRCMKISTRTMECDDRC
jgi:hypothetical protein